MPGTPRSSTSSPSACAQRPHRPVTAKIAAADGTILVKTLAAGADYTIAYSSCDLTLTMTDAAGPIAPNNHLIITYQAQIDPLAAQISPLTAQRLPMSPARPSGSPRQHLCRRRREYDETLALPPTPKPQGTRQSRLIIRTTERHGGHARVLLRRKQFKRRDQSCGPGCHCRSG